MEERNPDELGRAAVFSVSQIWNDTGIPFPHRVCHRRRAQDMCPDAQLPGPEQAACCERINVARGLQTGKET